MALQIIPLQASEIPVSKTLLVGNENYEFRFYYNKRFNFITLEIWQEERFLYSSKLVYGNNILKGFRKIPFAIVPLVEDDLYTENYLQILVNLETIGKTVNLYFEDGL